MYRGADKSLARPGKKQATATEDFDFIYPIYNHNWRDISTIYVYNSGPGSVVGIATAYGLDGPGIESRWGEIFRTSPDRS